MYSSRLLEHLHRSKWTFASPVLHVCGCGYGCGYGNGNGNGNGIITMIGAVGDQQLLVQYTPYWRIVGTERDLG